MIFLPIGTDISVRRLPKVTIGLIAICVAIFFFISLPNEIKVKKDAIPIMQQRYIILNKYYEEMMLEGRTEYYGPEGQDQFIQDFEDGFITSADNEDFIRYKQLLEEEEDLKHRLIIYEFGYKPSKFSLKGLIGHMFLHGGIGHLIGNMWFLWLVGVNLEDRWGRWIYLAFYLVSGMVAAIGFGAIPQNIVDIPLIGASGAIAGLMGAFMVRFYKAKIKYFYLFIIFIRPIWGTWEVSAWFAMGLWFLFQMLQHALFAGVANVAFAAHIMGFVFGVVITIILVKSGIEKEYINKIVTKEKAMDSANPLLGEAEDALNAGEYRKAVLKLEGALKVDPNNTKARMKIIQAYVEYVNNKKVGYLHFNKLLDTFRLKNDFVNFLMNYENYYHYFPGAVLPERNYYYYGYALAMNGHYKMAVDEYKKFCNKYAQSPLVPKVLYNASIIYIYKTGEIQIGQKLLYVILKRYPDLPWKHNIDDELQKIKLGQIPPPKQQNIKKLNKGDQP